MKKFCGLLAAVLIASVMHCVAMANSGPAYWNNGPSFEPVALEESSLDVVEEELLFDFNDPDSVWGWSPAAVVTATYQMSWPKEQPAASVQMAFPLISSVLEISTEFSGVSVDGQPLDHQTFYGSAVYGLPYQNSQEDYLNHLNDNIDYFLKENNEQRKYAYQREVRRCLKNIALATVRNVMDLKRNLDVTYKTEPSYQVKLAKLKKLDEKRRNIALLITRSEEVIDSQQPTFFRVAMDVQMRAVVSDVKLQLNDSYHNLIEIEKQIIHYLNLIAYQNRIFEKVRRLKYLRDQFLLEENTDIRRVIGEKNPVWMEPQPNYRIKLSLSNLHTSEVALELIRKVMSRRKKDARGPRNVAGAIPESYLSQAGEVMDRVNLQEVFNAFAASGTHLFRFVMNYSYGKPVAEEDKLLFFCQLASQYADELDFTDHYESTSEVEYPLIYLRQNP